MTNMSVKLLCGKGNIWPTITATLSNRRQNLVAVAFVSKQSQKLLPLREGDVLVVDMSPERLKTGATNPWVVAEFVRAGVSVFTCRGLHAKIFALGDQLIVGSTNLSNSSNSDLEEAAVITNDESTVKAGRKFVAQLTEQYGTLRVNEEMLRRAKAEFRESRWHTGGRKPNTGPEGWAVQVMRKLAPSNVKIPKRGAPHIEPDHSTTFRDIYLNESGDTVILGIYPGDTAQQAVSFYERLVPKQLVKLSKTNGWGAWPSFHLGYWSSSVRTDTNKSLNSYLRFWQQPPAELRLKPSKKPHQYTTLVRDLVRHRMIEGKVQEDVRGAIRGRPWVAIRPGIGVNFTWSSRRPPYRR